jgi:hypothetical protein
MVCDVHWQSDVVEGIFMGAAAVARMHAEPQLVEDIAVARKDVAGTCERIAAHPRLCRGGGGIESEDCRRALSRCRVKEILIYLVRPWSCRRVLRGFDISAIVHRTNVGSSESA